eukprot:3539322-Rhodomonas_salina.1
MAEIDSTHAASRGGEEERLRSGLQQLVESNAEGDQIAGSSPLLFWVFQLAKGEIKCNFPRSPYTLYGD